MKSDPYQQRSKARTANKALISHLTNRVKAMRRGTREAAGRGAIGEVRYEESRNAGLPPWGMERRAPAHLPALFTEVLRREILRTSP